MQEGKKGIAMTIEGICYGTESELEFGWRVGDEARCIDSQAKGGRG